MTMRSAIGTGRGYQWVPLALVIVATLMGGCRSAQPRVAAKDDPAKIESIAGTDLHRVQLSERAVQRLAIRTATVLQIPVTQHGDAQPPVGGVVRKVIPSAALFYDARGNAWTYTSPQPLTFVRAPVTVDYIQDQTAVLFEGPPIDTPVVTVGAAELFGAEFGVGH